MQYINMQNTDIDNCSSQYSVKDFIELLQQCSQSELETIAQLLKVSTKVDSKLNSFSDNPVKNSKISKELFKKSDKDSLADVAFTGKYSDILCPPQALPSPESLVIQLYGKNIIYDGSESTTINLKKITDPSFLNNIINVSSTLDELLKFHPLSVTVSVTPNQFSKLNTVTSYVVKWTTNYSNITNTKIYINDILQDIDTENNTFIIKNVNITDNVNIRIEVTNPKSTATGTATITGYYPLFYGTNSDYKYDQNILLNAKSGTITVNAGINDYIWFFSPKELTFWVGGFEGGFEKQQNINILDNNNKSISYYVYKSDNKNLGNTKVTWQQK